MGSRKRSARAREVRAFRDGLDDGGLLGDAFSREAERVEEISREHDACVRVRACESKQRYATRGEAEAARAACREHGAPELYVYRCRYCGGWHLTHHAPRG